MRLGLFIVCVCVLSFLNVWGAEWVDESKGTDIFLTGLITHRVSYSDIDGSIDIFEDSDEGLPLDYSNESLISIIAEGTWLTDYELEFEARYDEENTSAADDSLFLYFKIAKDKNFFSIGDHENGYLEETTFTHSTREFRGGEFHVQKGSVGLTVLGASSAGQSFQETLRGNGTYGPYDLSFVPIFDYSERVVLQIRDKGNFNQVLQSRELNRGQDYTIDYDDGELYFTETLQEEDFSGNPIVVVVTYQFEGESKTYGRATSGARLTFDANEYIQFGLTYLIDSPLEGSLSDYWDQRSQIGSYDVNVNIEDVFNFNFEQAFSGPESDISNAEGIRSRFEWKAQSNLILHGSYWRTESEFLTFANDDLAGGNVADRFDQDELFSITTYDGSIDLDPNVNASLDRDLESFSFGGVYNIGLYHTFTAGLRFTENDIENLLSSKLEQNTYYASFKKNNPDELRYFLGVEFFQTEEQGSSLLSDQDTFRVTGALQDKFNWFDFLGQMEYALIVEHEVQEDQIDPLEDQQQNDVLFRLSSFPVESWEFYIEQRESFLFEEREDDWTIRSDTSILGTEYTTPDNAKIMARILHRERNDLLIEEVFEEEDIYEIGFQARLFDLIEPLINFQFKEIDEITVGSQTSRETIRLNSGLIWNPIENLDIILRYSLERDISSTESTEAEDESREYSAEIQWELEKWQLFTKVKMEDELVTDSTIGALETQTQTYLGGLKYFFTARFFILTGLKVVEVSESLEEKREKYYVEGNYDYNNYLRLTLGYEYLNSENVAVTNEGEDLFEANVIYARGTISF